MRRIASRVGVIQTFDGIDQEANAFLFIFEAGRERIAFAPDGGVGVLQRLQADQRAGDIDPRFLMFAQRFLRVGIRAERHDRAVFDLSAVVKRLNDFVALLPADHFSPH
ncbi:MAG: hypothetical protein VCD31_16265, partial [Alphaproteobacteria bacterium]